MKIKNVPPPEEKRVTPKGKDRGIALITVMSILAVLTILSVAIITLAGNEMNSAKTYAEGVRVRQLSDTVVSLVVGQIREATRPDRNTGLFGNVEPTLWSCQPGMIRTYDDTGEFEMAYRLYSATSMMTEQEQDLMNASAAIRDWQTAPHRFVDLNEPAIQYDNEGNETGRFFPILDPRASDIDKIEGFTYDEFAGVQTGRRLPMPVEWLYLLKDGSLGSLDAGGKFKSRDQFAIPSADNPLVARIAFWTDDESSKINLNTASEAVPWDRPRAGTEEGRNYSQFQPVRNEVQRYPGHPATTCLSSVFFPNKYIDGSGSEALSQDEYNALLELAPKVNEGGTEGGTKKGTEPLTFDTDRLYASVDDVLFNIQREENTFLEKLSDGVERFERAKGVLTVRSRAPELNVHGRPRISLWPMSYEDTTAKRSVFDNTIAFCTELRDGRDRYFLQRHDPTSRHAEFYSYSNRENSKLYMYLMHQVYKNIPGYGASLATKYGADLKAPFTPGHYQDNKEYKKDHFAIALMMIDYLHTVNLHDGNVTQPFASMGGSSQSFGQISGFNLIDRNLASGSGSGTQSSSWHLPTLEPKGHGRMYTLSEVALVVYNTGSTLLAGFANGRPTFSTDQGIDLGVLKNVIQTPHPKYAEWTGSNFGADDVGKRFKFLEVGIIPEIFSVSQGFHQIHPKHTLRLMTSGTGYKGGLTENGGLKINGIPLELWGQGTNSGGGLGGPVIASGDPAKTDVRADLPKGWYGWGGSGGYRLLRFGEFTISDSDPGYRGPTYLANGTGPLSALYCQTPVVVRDGELLQLTQEQPVQLLMYDSIGTTTDVGNLVQAFNIRWADPGETVTMDQPKLASSTWAGWTRRFREAALADQRTNPVPVIDPAIGELVKGMVVSHGDYRHVSGRRNVPSELFRRHPDANKRTWAHSLTDSGRSIQLAPGATFSKEIAGRDLVEGANYGVEVRPDFSYDPSDRAKFAPLLSPSYKYPIDPSITRDFDNGIGGAPDGAYINKADDGADDVPGSSIFNQKYPYYESGIWDATQSYEDRNEENFSPNRMIPSAVTFGSLSSAMQANAPWTCLLFRPNVDRNPNRNPHLGEAGRGMRYQGDKTTLDGFEVPQMASVEDGKLPPDHLWLDLFWMPIVEPYPISEPFSTAGKVNLNYQMMPFTYIHRATALHAVLKSERILAIPTNEGQSYKADNQFNSGWHHKIDAAETLLQWKHKFDEGEIFKTGTEICEMFLYPKDEGLKWNENNTDVRRFWEGHKLTGDNTLEQPYANIYPRVTTQSNTFKVYMTVQSLQKVRGTPIDEFVVGKDKVTGEYRGSSVIERYLDPNDPDIPEYLNVQREHSQDSMEFFYRYRVLNVKQFAL